MGGSENLVAALSDLDADLTKDARFQLQDALLRVHDERFVLFEFERDEAFRLRERLLTRVLCRDQMKIRARYLDKVAEDLIVADAQAFDSRARSLTLLHLRQVSTAITE